MSYLGPLAVGYLLVMGVTTWYWPSALFVAFSDDDVTPGARGISVISFYLVGVVVSFGFDAVTTLLGVASAFALTGAMLLLRPAPIWGVTLDGPVTPKRAGVGCLVVGAVTAVASVV